MAGKSVIASFVITIFSGDILDCNAQPGTKTDHYSWPNFRTVVINTFKLKLKELFIPFSQYEIDNNRYYFQEKRGQK